MGSRKHPPVNHGITLDIREAEKDGTTFIRTSVITTPVKLNSKEVTFCDTNSRKDETPVKNPIPLKKRSLVRDMNWNEVNTGQKSTKHPMEMRSRKQTKLKEYYDYQEYDDFGEDLSFLFEEQLPDLECRPRRKSRKRRSPISTKKDSKIHLKSHSDSSSPSTSHQNDAKDSTSLSTTFSTRPNLKKATFCDLDNCNSRKLTSSKQHVGSPHFSDSNTSLMTHPDSGRDRNRSCDLIESTLRPQKRKNSSASSDVIIKRQKAEISSKNYEKSAKGDFDKNRTLSNEKTLKIVCDNELGRKGPLKLNCAAEESGLRNPSIQPNPTVTKMKLRRRHSTPSLGGSMYNEGKEHKMERTISTPAGGLGREAPVRKEGKYPKPDSRESSEDWNDEAFSCDEISDSEQFVDSPDSGFSSETSCSAMTPDGEVIGPMNFDPSKSSNENIDTLSRASRASSNDSGIQRSNLESVKPKNVADIVPQDGELRLVLCQKSIQEAQRLEREEKRRKEEAELQERYQCRWMDCPNPFENRCGADLHTHLEKYHAENYCCRWKGCKFFDIKSRKLTFLQRHIGEHSGEKPFKCILDGCDASFSSLSSRKRHVEAHYSEVSYPKAKVAGENGFPRYLLNSRRVKDKRKTLANRHDCIDNRTLSFIKHALIQNEVAMEANDGDDDIISDVSSITFQPEIIGEKKEKNGKECHLVKWKPEDMLSNEWITKSSALNEKTLNKAELPIGAKTALRRLFFFGRKPNGRKSTNRPSILETLF